MRLKRYSEDCIPFAASYQSKILHYSGYATYGAPGHNGYCLSLDADPAAGNPLMVMNTPNDPQVFGSVTDKITIAFWYYGDPIQAVLNYTIEAKAAGVDKLQLSTPTNSGAFVWRAGDLTNSSSSLSYTTYKAEDVYGKWNHIAVTKNTTAGAAKIYLNGVLVSANDQTGPNVGAGTSTGSIQNIDQFTIRRYTGKLDELKIWNCELTDGQIAYEAGLTTPFVQPSGVPKADGDNTVNMGELSALAAIWLKQTVWP